MVRQTPDAEAGAGKGSPPRGLRGLKGEVLGPPRPSTRAQLFVTIFGLLTITSIALPGYLDSPGQSLIFSGITATGMSELLDPSLHRFTVMLRITGPVIALTGLILMILS